MLKKVHLESAQSKPLAQEYISDQKLEGGKACKREFKFVDSAFQSKIKSKMESMIQSIVPSMVQFRVQSPGSRFFFLEGLVIYNHNLYRV